MDRPQPGVRGGNAAYKYVTAPLFYELPHPPPAFFFLFE
jgi:hypothetical protein